MGSEFETIEARITSLLAQLQFECGILQRMVHKNKNQHRRAPYFQHLLKIRRNLTLLQSANLEELVTSCFLVIKGERPKQQVHLLESLKRRKSEYGKYNFMERFLGAARLLAEMTEPILKAATEISILFAQEFFMGFSVVNMALLARLRVLVQQILLDVVSLFNMVSSLSRKKQSIKITHDGIEVFREFYPVSEDFVKLECVWKSDKFILVERKNEDENENQDEDAGANVLLGASAVNYDSVEVFLGDNHLVENKVEADSAVKEDPSAQVTDMNTDMLIDPSQIDDGKNTVCGEEGGENQNKCSTKVSFKESSSEVGLHALSQQSSPNAKPHYGSKKVVFLSIKNHTTAPQGVQSLPPLTRNVKALENDSNHTKDDAGDSLASLLSDVNAKDSTNEPSLVEQRHELEEIISIGENVQEDHTSAGIESNGLGVAVATQTDTENLESKKMQSDIGVDVHAESCADNSSRNLVIVSESEDDDLVSLVKAMEKDRDGKILLTPCVAATEDNLVVKVISELEESLKIPLKDIASSDSIVLGILTALKFLSQLPLEDGTLPDGLKAVIDSLHHQFPIILGSFKKAFAAKEMKQQLLAVNHKWSSLCSQFELNLIAARSTSSS